MTSNTDNMDLDDSIHDISIYSLDSEDYDDDEEDSQVEGGGFQFTGMDRLGSGTDESWELESYANDSMELTKLRLAHCRMHYDYDDEVEDWTVQSDCYDSLKLTQTRLELQHEQYNTVNTTVNRSTALPRINRRLASLGDFVLEEHGATTPAFTPQPVVRRSSMSSASEQSLSSGSGHSDNPAGKRPSVVRHKSMPYVKSKTPLSQTVPLPSTPPRASKRGNNGTPCAA